MIDMKSLLLHKATEHRVNNYLDNPATAIALVGPSGSGKKFLSMWIVEKLLDNNYEAIINSPNLIKVKTPTDKKEIGIDAVRAAINGLSLKTGNNKLRVVLINDAHYLSLESQNALLKILEQPPRQTLFILTISNLSKVLPTITSRLEQINVLPISEQSATLYFSKDHKANELNIAYLLSSGKIGLLTQLLKNQKNPLIETISESKKFLTLKKYDRQIFIEDYIKSREKLALFLDALSRVLLAAHHSSLKRHKLEDSKRISSARLLIIDLNEKLSQSASTKLVALHLVNSLKV